MQATRKILLTALALAAPWATAQTVWRCGATYSQQPCAGGTALGTAPHTPTADEAAKAAGAARVDADRAATLEKARVAQEKSAPGAASIKPAEPPQPKPVADKRTGASKLPKPEEFTATVPGTGKKKKKK